MTREEYDQDVYAHERMTGQHDLERAEEARERNTGLEYEQSLGEPQRPDEGCCAHLATFRLRVFGPEGWPGFGGHEFSVLGTALAEAEENISDLLPGSYYAKFEEVDE